MTNERAQTSVDQPDRESFATDVVIVGAGPAGLSAAISLRQQAIAAGQELSVLVLEKGSEVGAHILSGAVFDPAPLSALFPNWQVLGAPLHTPVTKDEFLLLGPSGDICLPGFVLPPLMRNHGTYIISLGALCRWLEKQATGLGVDVFPEQAAVDLLRDKNDRITGVVSGDKGVGKDGKPGRNFAPGLHISAKYVLIAEGARGTLSEKLITEFKLDKDSDQQKYGIGLKELWQIDPKHHRPGLVRHTLGWPLDNKTGGGGFLYHFGDNLVAAGFVVHLNYQNPFLSPYDELQRFKTHPAIKNVFADGRRLSFGARAITEGGWQSVPKLTFPGGGLLGCAAGFVNVPRIKGAHNAMWSGIQAAKAAFGALSDPDADDQARDKALLNYEQGWRKSPIGVDLKPVRNVKPLWSRLGTQFGVLAGGADMWLNTLLPGLSYKMRQGKPDRLCLMRAADSLPPEYPAPDNVLTFDKMSSVALSNTGHAEDQPVHLKLFNKDVPLECNLPEYSEPAQLYCPAGVYEVVEDEKGAPKFVINAQNCVHCKTCDIKDPWGNITWTPPEGGDGPNYPNM